MIYQKYTSQIKSILEPYQALNMVKNEERSFSTMMKASSDIKNIQSLADLMGIKEIKSITFNKHPDFVHLLDYPEKSENHYIISAFIDIKGSTNYHKKNYTLKQIAAVTQVVLLASIHTCNLFGGHIQRLQGDGVFVYFGGKAIQKKEAVLNALYATSFLCLFMKYELHAIFEDYGIEEVKARIGIDFGDDHEVLWQVFGDTPAVELTTNSLHTSLAPKMQQHAQSNGIVVGKNIFDRVDEEVKEHCHIIRKEDGNIDYIFQSPTKSYSQYDFHWYNFLKKLPFVKINKNGSLEIDYQEGKRLQSLLEKGSGVNFFIDKKGNQTQEKQDVKLDNSNHFYGAKKHND